MVFSLLEFLPSSSAGFIMRNFWWLQLVVFGILCSNKVFIHGSRVWMPECFNENGENICIHGQKRMIDQSFYSGYGKRTFIPRMKRRFYEIRNPETQDGLLNV
ncbi:hypothetical protein PHET_02619 [Paragonimus heterotremus]|uniref:Uncharacterized protein n=1 Tax=Paragonimus heterotremus TaxID=100268 RepID=A0A8J4TD03_9TREM|nr:hypothetical protein PHET_02619 [Paragonimus heterotremus]